MKLPGNNTLELCGAALCAIVARHLNEAQRYSSDEKVPIVVSYATARVESGSTVFVFRITTDPEPEAGDA